jgi:hypothetical protein
MALCCRAPGERGMSEGRIFYVAVHERHFTLMSYSTSTRNGERSKRKRDSYIELNPGRSLHRTQTSSAGPYLQEEHHQDRNNTGPLAMLASCPLGSLPPSIAGVGGVSG